MPVLLSLFFLFSPLFLWGGHPPFSPLRSSPCELVGELQRSHEMEEAEKRSFPHVSNLFFIGGNGVTPSARTFCEGTLGGGYSHVPPYRNYNFLCQPLQNLELSLNYRIFVGVPDPVLTAMGFGDFSDKGANWKWVLCRPEESDYLFPGFAVGMEDFLGTRAFKSYYAVATQVIPEVDLELTVGWGKERLQGLFGAVTYFPFRRFCSPWLESLALFVEYDPIDYTDPAIEKHPQGRVKNSAINAGIKGRFWESLDLHLAYIRGDQWVCAGHLLHPMGESTGWLPKVRDPLVYRKPVNRKPLGEERLCPAFVEEWVEAFANQGFVVSALHLDCEGASLLRVELENGCYRDPEWVRRRIQAVLVALTPHNFQKVSVTLKREGVATLEYRYDQELFPFYSKQARSFCGRALLGLGREPSCPSPLSQTIYCASPCGFQWDLSPRWRTFFGSSTGKFKYSLGPSLSFKGSVWRGVQYEVQGSWDLLSNLKSCKDVDRVNPSQIVNVRSDIVSYYHNESPYLEKAFLEKNSHWGEGVYTRIAGGYFELMYGGVASEILYYPVGSCWALGLEGGYFKKRETAGLGFQNQLRQLEGFQPRWVDHVLFQGFVSLYWDVQPLNVDVKVSVGQFLAHDKGVRCELSRYFSNGLRLNMWYTYTDGMDQLNGGTYHDKGIGFSMPTDFFQMESSRSRWGYGMSAWLRDVGAIASTGGSLHSLLRSERR